MKERIAALRSAMAGAGCDAFFSISGPDNQYLSGFMTSFGEVSAALAITQDRAVFLTDSRYTEQAGEQVKDYEIRQISSDLVKEAGECLAELGAHRVLFDPSGLTVEEMDRLSRAHDAEYVPRRGVVGTLRESKDPAEIEAVRAASNLAEGVLADVLGELRAGVTEREAAARIEFEFKRRGATGSSFDTIVLFGARSSLPHGHPGEARLKSGDIVLIDMGCRRGGYCSDLTRTYAFATIPGAWFEEIYNVTLEAQLAALEAVRPGMKCVDVDAVARERIKKAGYGDRFGHGLGHGVGIEIHEDPRVSPRSHATLKEGMVITIEPGIYLPGQGGVRIEDLVLVRAAGAEVLTKTPKELKVLAE